MPVKGRLRKAASTPARIVGLLRVLANCRHFLWQETTISAIVVPLNVEE